NNRMELTAAIRALAALKGRQRVVLHTDSKYLMDGVRAWLPGWKRRGWKTAAGKQVKNQDLWEALDELASRHDVTWKWVRGHSGHAGNEEADALANRAIDEMLAAGQRGSGHATLAANRPRGRHTNDKRGG